MTPIEQRLEQRLARLEAREDIRELVLLYSRGLDRQDLALLRSLYADDAVEQHAHWYSGSGHGYVDWLAERFGGGGGYAGHHVCNHAISVQGDVAEGEVYCLAYSIVPDGKDGFFEDLLIVRYIDGYRREHGQWKFARRTCTIDLHNRRPLGAFRPAGGNPLDDPGVAGLTHRLFARGPRG